MKAVYLFFVCLFLTLTAQYCHSTTVLLGPSNTPPSNNETYYIGVDGKTKCKVCEVRCKDMELFHDGNGVTNCVYKYYYYGCLAESHCVSPQTASQQEILAAHGFCMAYNGCKLTRKRLQSVTPKELNGRDEIVMLLAYVKKIYKEKKNTELDDTTKAIETFLNEKKLDINKVRGFILTRIGVPAALFLQYQIVEHMKDAILSGVNSFREYKQRKEYQQLNVTNIPEFFSPLVGMEKKFEEPFFNAVLKYVREKKALPEEVSIKNVNNYLKSVEKQLQDAKYRGNAKNIKEFLKRMNPSNTQISLLAKDGSRALPLNLYRAFISHEVQLNLNRRRAYNIHTWSIYRQIIADMYPPRS